MLLMYSFSHSVSFPYIYGVNLHTFRFTLHEVEKGLCTPSPFNVGESYLKIRSLSIFIFNFNVEFVNFNVQYTRI